MHVRNAQIAALIATVLHLLCLLEPKRGCASSMSIEGRVASDIVAMESACDHYARDRDGAYPDDLARLVERDRARRSCLRAESTPRDPWRRPYLYAPAGAHGVHPRIWTYGRDGIAGGDGDDRDVDNWMLRAGFEPR